MILSASSDRPDPDHAFHDLLALDEPLCLARIGRVPMRLRHGLTGHHLLSLTALAELADALPVSSVECLPTKLKVVNPGSNPPSLQRPSDTVLNIEKSGRWMVMKNIEQVAAYKNLLDDVVKQLVQVLPRREGKIVLSEAFLFLSAPESVTPVHIDAEHNVLMHVTGSKQVNVGKFPNRHTEQGEITRYLAGGHRNLDSEPEGLKCHQLESGDALYMPPWRPHWVKTGPHYSISISATFRTQRSRRYEYTHMVNIKLRKLGIHPRPAGESVWLDTVKSSYVISKRWLKHTLYTLIGPGH